MFVMFAIPRTSIEISQWKSFIYLCSLNFYIALCFLQCVFFGSVCCVFYILNN